MATKYGTRLVMHDRQGRLIVDESFYMTKEQSGAAAALARYKELRDNGKMDAFATHYFEPIHITE